MLFQSAHVTIYIDPREQSIPWRPQRFGSCSPLIPFNLRDRKRKKKKKKKKLRGKNGENNGRNKIGAVVSEFRSICRGSVRYGTGTLVGTRFNKAPWYASLRHLKKTCRGDAYRVTTCHQLSTYGTFLRTVRILAPRHAFTTAQTQNHVL